MRPSVRKTLKMNPLGRAKEKLKKGKATVRAKVAHCSYIVKYLKIVARETHQRSESFSCAKVNYSALP